MNFGHFTEFRARRHCVANRSNWITSCKWLSGQLISSEPQVLIIVNSTVFSVIRHFFIYVGKLKTLCANNYFLASLNQGRIQGARSPPPKTYESNFSHHDFVQFGKQHSRYKASLPSIVLSQQCCEVYFISLTVVNA